MSPFVTAMGGAFVVGAVICVFAAACSVLRGKKHVNDQQKLPEP